LVRKELTKEMESLQQKYGDTPLHRAKP